MPRASPPPRATPGVRPSRRRAPPSGRATTDARRRERDRNPRRRCGHGRRLKLVSCAASSAIAWQSSVFVRQPPSDQAVDGGMPARRFGVVALEAGECGQRRCGGRVGACAPSRKQALLLVRCVSWRCRGEVLHRGLEVRPLSCCQGGAGGVPGDVDEHLQEAFNPSVQSLSSPSGSAKLWSRRSPMRMNMMPSSPDAELASLRKNKRGRSRRGRPSFLVQAHSAAGKSPIARNNSHFGIPDEMFINS